MKNKLLLLLGLIVVLFIGTELFGYTAPKKAEIRRAHLSKRDKSLLQAGGAIQVLVFSYRLRGLKLTHFDEWIEVYQNGKDLGEKFRSEGRIKGINKGMITFAIQKPESKKDPYGRWIISNSDKKGYGESMLLKKMHPLKGSEMTTKIDSVPIKAGKTISLAAIVRDPNHSLMETPDLSNRKSLVQLSHGDKTVIVLKCKFSK